MPDAPSPPPATNDRRPQVLLLAAAYVALGAAFFIWLLLSHRTFFANPDNTEQFWAWYQKAAANLHDGQLTLWDANTNAGHSYVGETQTGVFYPLNLLWLAVLGSAEGIGATRLDALVVLHVVIAALGAALLAREAGTGPRGSFLAGLVFAFTGPIFARAAGQTAIFFGLALMPWAVFWAVRFLQGGRMRHATLAGATLGLSILAGHFQPALHGAMAILIFGLLLPAAEVVPWRRRLVGGIAFGGALVLVALPQLAYSLPYLARAYRFTSEPEPTAPGETLGFEAFVRDYSGGPEAALNALNPDVYDVPDGNRLYIGLATLALLAIAAAIAGRGLWAAHRRALIAAGAVAAFGFVAMLGGWTPLPRILHAIPFVAQVRELGRYSALVALGGAVLIGLLVSRLLDAGRPPLEGRSRRRWTIAGAALVLNGAYLAIEHNPGLTGWFSFQLALAGALLLLVARGDLRRPVIGALTMAIVAVAALSTASHWSVSTRSPLYPTTDYARTALVTAVEQECRGHRTYVQDDALPRNIADVFRDIRTHNGFGATMHVPFYDFITSSGLGEQGKLLDLRCIVTGKDGTAPDGYELQYEDPGTGRRVWVDPTTSPLTDPQLEPVAARTLQDDDRHRRWEVDLKAPTTVTISSILYPGWKLRLDGREVEPGEWRTSKNDTPVFPTVDVPAGKHTIEWSWNGLPF